MGYTIHDRFITKDPQWEVCYDDDDDGVSNTLVAVMFDDLLGFDGRWTAPDQPMTTAQVERVLDRLVEWVETRAPCRVPRIATLDGATTWRTCTPRRSG
jgi:hypothetical protein